MGNMFAEQNNNIKTNQKTNDENNQQQYTKYTIYIYFCSFFTYNIYYYNIIKTNI
jgi:hypothetical protein